MVFSNCHCFDTRRYAASSIVRSLAPCVRSGFILDAKGLLSDAAGGLLLHRRYLRNCAAALGYIGTFIGAQGYREGLRNTVGIFDPSLLGDFLRPFVPSI